MSWLSEIAGRAENLLNQIDQNAASVIETSGLANGASNGKGGARPSGGERPAAAEEGGEYGRVSAYPYGPVDGGGLSKGAGSASTKQQQQQVAKRSTAKASQDEELLQFLNAPETKSDNTHQSAASRQPEPPPQCPSSPATMSSSSSSWTPLGAAANGDGRTHSRNSSVYADGHSAKESVGSYQNGVGSLVSSVGSSRRNSASSSANVGSANNSVVVDVGEEEPAISQMVRSASFEDENHLLKAEIASLNQEMSQVLSRAKAAEKALSVTRAESVQLCADGRASERRLRELESELEERVRAESEARAALEERLRRAEQRVAEAEGRAEQEGEREERARQEKAKAEAAMAETIKLLEQELSRAQQRASSLETDRDASESRGAELSASVALLRKELEAAHAQHDAYKAKAKKVLAEKDKVIAGMGEHPPGADGHPAAAEGGAREQELTQALRERDLLRDESAQLTDRCSALSRELSDLERQLEQQLDRARGYREEAAKAVAEAGLARDAAEQDLKRTKDDLRYLQDESSRRKASYLSELKAKEDEAEGLRASLAAATRELEEQQGESEDGSAPPRPASKAAQLEERLQQLTESLLQKQALLEAVSAEKTSLVLQIERMEKWSDQERTFRRSNAAANLASNSPSDPPASSVPPFLRETPHDTRVARGVKRAYSSLDKLSLRIGVTLRRYPLARIFVIAYMTLLHFWVFLILYKATPEPNKR